MSNYLPHVTADNKVQRSTPKLPSRSTPNNIVIVKEKFALSVASP